MILVRLVKYKGKNYLSLCINQTIKLHFSLKAFLEMWRK